MSLRDILGLYGPNKPKWDDQAYKDIVRANVKWFVWRTDADPEAPRILANTQRHVIAQAPDRFNGNAGQHPAWTAMQDYDIVSRTCSPGTLFVPDNEPNLNLLRAGTWYAEQWTRYLRAYMAVWRWLDPGGRFPIVTPALAVGPDRNSDHWHVIQHENLLEADGIGLHAYWQTVDQIPDAMFGAHWRIVPAIGKPKRLYVLEYANTSPRLTHEQTIDQYETFLRGLPDTVRCAALFGLGLTDDWSRFRITEPVLDWLASLS